MRKQNKQKTFHQISKQYFCDITRDEFENYVNTNVEKDITLKHPDTFASLILNTPIDSNSRKLKFSDFGINNRNTNLFLTMLFNALRVSKPVLFNTYSEGTESKTNITLEAIKLIKSQKPGLINYCGSGILSSLYTHLRNALAHGNILLLNGKIAFYSFSLVTGKEHSSAYRLTFYLCLKEEKLYKQFVSILNGFKNRK